MSMKFSVALLSSVVLLPFRLLGLSTDLAKAELIISQQTNNISSVHRQQAYELMLQGNEQFSQEHFQVAISLWDQSLTLYSALQDNVGQQAAHTNIGLAARHTGQYALALNHIEQAFSLQKISENPLGLSEMNVGLGDIHTLLGNFFQAIEHYEAGLELAESSGNNTAKMTILASLGVAHSRAESPIQAANYYQQSLQMAIALDNPEGIGYAHHNLGVLFAVERDFDQAIEHYEKGLAVATTHLLKGGLYRSLGSAQDEIGNYEAAVESLSQSANTLNEIDVPLELAITANNLAHAYFSWGNDKKSAENQTTATTQWDKAENHLRQAIAILDNLRKETTSDANRVSIFDTQVMTYNLIQQVLVAKGETEAALIASEEGRSRAFSTLLATDIDQPNDSTNLTQIKQFAQAHNLTLVEYALVPENNTIHPGLFHSKERFE